MSEQVKRLARLIPMNRENLLNWKKRYFSELTRGGIVETLRPEGDVRASSFAFGNVSPLVGYVWNSGTIGRSLNIIARF